MQQRVRWISSPATVFRPLERLPGSIASLISFVILPISTAEPAISSAADGRSLLGTPLTVLRSSFRPLDGRLDHRFCCQPRLCALVATQCCRMRRVSPVRVDMGNFSRPFWEFPIDTATQLSECSNTRVPGGRSGYLVAHSGRKVNKHNMPAASPYPDDT